MSLQRKTPGGGIETMCDHDKVIIKLIGCSDIVVARPGTISLSEWEMFWGGETPEHKYFNANKKR